MIQPEGSAGGLVVGTVVGETYRLERLIGQGGMGAVWEATHLRLPGKRVAMKVLLQTIREGSEAFTRFRREAEIAARLGHANIVEVLDFNVMADGTPYLVLELLAGESLAQRLRRGPIVLDEAMAITRQIGRALAVAHKHGVIHRDLKPENVYLCPPGDDGGPPRVKVLDFGISKIAGSSSVQTQEQRVLGTPQYMAPEQAKGQSNAVDARSDVFSLGIIVYEMLSGRAAFDGENLAAVVFKVVYEEPAPLELVAPGVPPAVVAAVNRALAKFPDARFPDVSSFVEAMTGRGLGTLDRASPTTSKPPPARSSSPGAFAPTVGSGELGLSATVDAPHDVPGPRLPEPRSRTWIWLAAALAVAGLGAGYALTRPAPVVAFVGVPDAAPLVRSGVDAAPPVDAAPVVDASPVASVDAAPARPPSETAGGEDEDEDLGGAASFLASAQRAFAAADYREAIRLAIRSMNEKKTMRAHALIARSYCQLGDIGNARAQLRSLRPRERTRVIRYCGRVGVDLRE